MWTRVNLDHGLSYESWAAGEPRQGTRSCVSVLETLKYAKDCNEAEHVIYMNTDLGRYLLPLYACINVFSP